MRVNAWSLDVDAGLCGHLRFALNEKNIWNSLAIVCVSCGEPWDMEDNITSALHLLENHVNNQNLEDLGDLQASGRISS